MFNSRKAKNTIDSLIGAATSIHGDVHFKGGLRIDGHIIGNVIADEALTSMLVISEKAKVEGEIRVAHLVVNGEIFGNVFSSDLLELQPKARITGNVSYKALEMHSGAVVSGKLTHEQAAPIPALKLLETSIVPQISQSVPVPSLDLPKGTKVG
ncbi:bactofilin family protein [Glaciimonas immobilis]|uniref:Cytoskeletal protein CcmA (Bactofilin family) n=1 Tax=Glaciimonas immobilis TaxID=728004 RepID=A0A840RU81_9BURK|nr:polymer-forming cytoskeletal protein [Glaciimonas immobilis]KAF3999653.1 polymer-forming cytoskeletal protein [Glaciimonas immobilis]MBB5200090.1 cytoskeletal protein CcmA (bactofilin family) [Glaciimonas immobilis]